MAGHSYLRTHDLSAEHLLIDLSEAVTELHGLAGAGQDRRGVTLVKQGAQRRSDSPPCRGDPGGAFGARGCHSAGA